MEGSFLQIFRVRANIMWIYIFHVRVACAWEGYPTSTGTPWVSKNLKVKLCSLTVVAVWLQQRTTRISGLSSLQVWQAFSLSSHSFSHLPVRGATPNLFPTSSNEIYPILETPTKILYTMLWGGIVFPSLGRRVYEWVTCSLIDAATDPFSRFPTSLPWVILDRLEKFYICGFPLLQLVVSVLPLIAQSVSGSTQVLPQAMPSATCSAEAVGPSLSCAGAGRVMPDASTSITTNVILSQMEFLPLMLTSVYCAVGLVWAFIRLGVLYLRTY